MIALIFGTHIPVAASRPAPLGRSVGVLHRVSGDLCLLTAMGRLLALGQHDVAGSSCLIATEDSPHVIVRSADRLLKCLLSDNWYGTGSRLQLAGIEPPHVSLHTTVQYHSLEECIGPERTPASYPMPAPLGWSTGRDRGWKSFSAGPGYGNQTLHACD